MKRFFAPFRLLQLVLTVVTVVTAAYLVRTFTGLNRHVVIPGRVYRCAQPSDADLRRVIEQDGIRTVVNLRGTAQTMNQPRSAWYRLEAEATADADIHQEDITLSAKLLPPPAELRRLIEVLDRAERPLLIHCKQGADRTGLAAALVLLLHTDGTLADARRQLWPIYGHFPVGGTIAMDDFLDRYETWLAKEHASHSPDRLRHWATSIYAPGAARSELAWITTPEKTIPNGRPTLWKVRATNTADDAWQFQPGDFAAIHLVYKVARNGTEWIYENKAGLFRRVMHPGESVDLQLALPGLAPGKYVLAAEFIDARGCSMPIRANSFVKCGDAGISWEFTVE